MISKIFYYIMIIYIAVVSSIDMYWSIKIHEVLLDIEQNPIGVFLIEKNDDSVALFMSFKFLGTIFVVMILSALYNKNKKLAWSVITGIVIFQTFLIYYVYSKPKEEYTGSKNLYNLQKLEDGTIYVSPVYIKE
tara:strand:+ start:1447 stop:1848 length:402 start_codon:yes stop_codon:yes gene_type:complete